MVKQGKPQIHPHLLTLCCAILFLNLASVVQAQCPSGEMVVTESNWEDQGQCGETMEFVLTSTSGHEIDSVVWMLSNDQITDSVLQMNSTLIELALEQSTTISYTAFDLTCGGSVTGNRLISIDPLSIEISGDWPVCDGEVHVLSASGANNYLWSTGEITSEIIVYNEELIIVQGYRGGTCFDIDSIWLAVTPTPTPQIEYHVENNTVGLSDGGDKQSNSVVLWTFGDGLQSNQSDSVTHVYSEVGDYNVSLSISTANGCRAMQTIMIRIDSISPLYQNATTPINTEANLLRLSSCMMKFSPDISQVSIYDMAGRKMADFDRPRGLVNHNLKRGIYVVMMENNERQSFIKVMVP